MSVIACIIGTRPELIKMAPLILELKRRGLQEQVMIVNTAQHKELLDPYWKIFDLRPDVVLDVMLANQSLSSLTARAISQLQAFVDGLSSKPAAFIAQGDTTTVMASSVVAFYNRIPFIHLEAGLRSFDFENPFPEEFNRKVAAIHCSLHLAPTEKSKGNLLREGYAAEKIQVTGNTVVDALHFIRTTAAFKNNQFIKQILGEAAGRKLVLITCHRRENHGEALLNILDAVRQLAEKHSEYFFLWSLHPNPNVKNVITNDRIAAMENVKLVAPLDYPDLLAVMDKSALIISDSGGIQEEAPSFNVPVLVLRETTERPEGVDSGVATLVGSDSRKITEGFNSLIDAPKTQFTNPYGDGNAASRIIDIIQKKFLLNSHVI